jgi:signal peptidase I
VSEPLPPPKAPPSLSRRQRFWFWAVVTVASPFALLIVLAGMVSVGLGWSTRNTPSGAMMPTLMVGDYFTIDKRAYAFGSRPRRGDIVTFTVPKDAGAVAKWSGNKVEYVKRIVGLPGERVEMRGGVPVINGRPAVQERVGEFTYGPTARNAVRLRERFADGTTFEVLKLVRNGPGDEGGPFTVPPGSYFVMGDNRDDSLDSRYGGATGGRWWFVPGDVVVGRANYIYWSGFDRLDRVGQALK